MELHIIRYPSIYYIACEIIPYFLSSINKISDLAKMHKNIASLQNGMIWYDCI